MLSPAGRYETSTALQPASRKSATNAKRLSARERLLPATAVPLSTSNCAAISNPRTSAGSNNDLLSWAKIYFDLIPPEQPLPVGRVRRLLQARTVSDLAPPESHRMAVRLDETVATAIETMASFGLEDRACRSRPHSGCAAGL